MCHSPRAGPGELLCLRIWILQNVVQDLASLLHRFFLAYLDGWFGVSQEKVLHSLELSTLEGSLPLPQRQELATSALASLAAGANSSLKQLMWPLCKFGLGCQERDNALSKFRPAGVVSGEDSRGGQQLVVKPVNHPLLSCFLLSAGFVEQRNAAAPTNRLKFGVALLSFLPVDMPVRRVEVRLFSQRVDDKKWQNFGPKNSKTPKRANAGN